MGISEGILVKIGLSVCLVEVIMRCVIAISFDVLINGDPSDPFFPSRGIRQGDPLSLYLFLFCAQALFALIRRKVEKQVLHGVRICRNAPAISKLLFTDDKLIFGTATSSELAHVKEIL